MTMFGRFSGSWTTSVALSPLSDLLNDALKDATQKANFQVLRNLALRQRGISRKHLSGNCPQHLVGIALFVQRVTIAG
jgi:hypothetical protein